jgi:hypothetical protein
MEISPSNARSGKKIGDNVEEEAGASYDATPVQARRRRCRVMVVRWRRARGFGPEEEEGVGVKNESYPPLPYLYQGPVVVGTVVVLHYADRFCRGVTRGGATWGGGSDNRATRRMMAVNSCRY